VRRKHVGSEESKTLPWSGVVDCHYLRRVFVGGRGRTRERTEGMGMEGVARMIGDKARGEARGSEGQAKGLSSFNYVILT
jgi:hypothetical protein